MALTAYYLKIDTIKGESQAEGFTEQMQIESWSFGSTNTGSAGQGTGMGTGKAHLQDYHFVVQNGSASPQLFLASVKGNHIPQAILSCQKTGGDGTPYTYLKVTFADLVISSFQTGGSASGGSLPMEQVSFNFTKISMEYFQQDTKGGGVTRTNTVSYDTKAVKGEGA
ncbi:MAG: type VI secretion system tube protein Hcp [Acidobacteriota bacterium]|nr:type VI secretion system tube protein Hcp [Acidobacteriota bacterium]